jgi:hypothetical protein
MFMSRAHFSISTRDLFVGSRVLSLTSRDLLNSRGA